MQKETTRVSRKPVHSPLQVTALRWHEFLREKEAVFWVFIFPMLMTFALGIAFRNTAPEKTFVAIEADATNPNVNEIQNVLIHAPEINATILASDEAAKALRSGKVSIVVRPQNGAYDYRFDPTRPESRTARLIVDDVIQRAKGRN